MNPYQATIEELESAGIKYQEEMKGKHIKIRFRVKGRKCTVVVSKSTSDGRRAGLNARLLVRRVIRSALGE